MTKGIALDIDNTIAATNLHWVKSLTERFGGPSGVTPEELTEQHVLAQDIAHFQTPEAKEWMEFFRNSNDAHYDLPLIENANHMANKLHAIMPVAAYVTGRWEGVREKTELWLAKHDFPRAPVFMRPESTRGGHVNEWKGRFLPTLYPDIVGIVDDDPRLMDYIPDDYQGTIFLYKNTEHKEVSFPVVKCKGWNEVLEEVTKRYGQT